MSFSEEKQKLSRNRKQNAIHRKGTYCFMNLVSDAFILIYVLGLNTKCILYCEVIQKCLKHCFGQAFVHHLVRMPQQLPTSCWLNSEQTSSCLIHQLFSQTWAFYSDSQASYVSTGLPSPWTDQCSKQKKKNPLLFLPSFQVWKLLVWQHIQLSHYG